ncbi:T9SS type A sorting domain-containing protein [Catalinimonas alkaloidigena]|nr:T9SS type A sorting domain-containing protein [Catalinimonas alkaloidigena]
MLLTCQLYSHAANAAGFRWTGSANDNYWGSYLNWEPNGVPGASDTAIFDNGATQLVYLAANDTIGGLALRYGTRLNLTRRNGAVSDPIMLVIQGFPGATALTVDATSILDIRSETGTPSKAMYLKLDNGATGLINGRVVAGGVNGSGLGLVKLLVTNRQALVFADGAVFQTRNLEGSPFNTVGEINTVLFRNGSTYIQQSGETPFGFSDRTKSKVVFEAEALYRYRMAGAAPDLAGRKYPNLIFDGGVSVSISNGVSGFPSVTMTDLIVQGNATLNVSFTTSKTNFIVNGDLIVRAGSSLTFGAVTPSLAPYIRMQALSPKSILAIGTLFIAPSAELQLANGNVTLDRDLSIAGKFNLSSNLYLNGYSLTLNQEVVRSLTSNKYIITNNGGKVIQTLANATQPVAVPIGTENAYMPVNLECTNCISNSQFAFSVNDGLTKSPNGSGAPVTTSAVLGTWTIDPPNDPGVQTADITFFWPNTRQVDENGDPVSNPNNLVQPIFAQASATEWTVDPDAVGDAFLNTPYYYYTLNEFPFGTNAPYVFSFVDALNNPLPVTLLSFEGRTEGRIAMLNWVTAMEENNDRFEVEKSLDGRNFEVLDVVKGMGTTTARQEYQFVDDGFRREAYYRLRQVDFDGGFAYSPVIYVSTRNLPGFEVYPNPLQRGQRLSIELNDRSTTASALSLSLVSARGQVLYQATGDLDAQVQGLNEQLTNAPNGLYLIRINALEGQRTIRLIKQ